MLQAIWGIQQSTRAGSIPGESMDEDAYLVASVCAQSNDFRPETERSEELLKYKF
ncbi:MAG TPA: hypothetical protein VFC65_03690 [Prolixibacteraceae bacterium]|nr:hypothetical protein [Prolixibacteraceae bacterium]